jgi:hypothetical protein
MIFRAVNCQTVELKITNYQFPDTSIKDWDGNWLNVYINVNSKLGNWQTIDPSLTTWELRELIDWFYGLADNLQPKWTDMEFTEPNLSFYLLNSFMDKKKVIRIKFALESRPKSATNDIIYYVDFEADKKELKRIGDDLSIELEKFPIRK